jgi:hypothetical protein
MNILFFDAKVKEADLITKESPKDISLKNRKTCETTNRVIEQVYFCLALARDLPRPS